MNKSEQLKVGLAQEVAAIAAASPVVIVIKDFDENGQMITNKNNFKSMRLDYIPDKDIVMVEARGKRIPWPITEPISEMAVQLLMQITG